MDAGFGVANGNGESLCGADGLLVASYRRLAPGPSGNSAELMIANPALNLLSCLTGAPANFRVWLKLAPDQLPVADIPLNLRTCMSARANAQLP